MINKRKTFEILFMLFLDAILYLLLGSVDFVVLFSFGYVWNWVASQQETIYLDNKRYRFSTLKVVLNLQRLIQPSDPRVPIIIKMILKSLPAGVFWGAVIIFHESHMPWWVVFVGSFTMELVLLEQKIFHPQLSSQDPSLPGPLE
jgi:hypothetical protein